MTNYNQFKHIYIDCNHRLGTWISFFVRWASKGDWDCIFYVKCVTSKNKQTHYPYMNILIDADGKTIKAKTPWFDAIFFKVRENNQKIISIYGFHDMVRKRKNTHQASLFTDVLQWHLCYTKSGKRGKRLGQIALCIQCWYMHRPVRIWGIWGWCEVW